MCARTPVEKEREFQTISKDHLIKFNINSNLELLIMNDSKKFCFVI